MERPSYIVRLDMIDTGTVDANIRMKQGDSGAIVFFKMYNNGNEYYDASVIPDVYFKRPDGSTVFGTAVIGYNNMYAYTIIGTELAVAGTVIMDVKFKLGNGRESSSSCRFECVADTLGDKLEQTTIYWNDVKAVLQDLSDMVGDSEEIITEVRTCSDAAASSAAEAVDSALSAAASAAGADEAISNSEEVKALIGHTLDKSIHEKTVSLTKLEFDSIDEKDPDVTYYITDDEITAQSTPGPSKDFILLEEHVVSAETNGNFTTTMERLKQYNEIAFCIKDKGTQGLNPIIQGINVISSNILSIDFGSITVVYGSMFIKFNKNNNGTITAYSDDFMEVTSSIYVR